MGALGEGHFSERLENGMVHLACLSDEENEEVEVDGSVGLGSEVCADPIEDAVKVLLQGLDEDYSREGLKRTPFRVAKAFRDGTRGYRQSVNDIVDGALFPEAGLSNGKGLAGGAGGLVVVRDIDLFSYCESCLLPFRVRCHIGYVPSGQRVVGLSKLARVAGVFAKRLQAPHRLADEICSALQCSIKPAGVAVALQCWHIQLPEELKSHTNMKTQPNLETHGWAQVPACSWSGVLESGGSGIQADFLTLLKLRGVNMDKDTVQKFSVQDWCPLKSPEIPLCNGHGGKNHVNGKMLSNSVITRSTMVAAVTKILLSIGEDPLRNELIGTPYRFVQWLMRFKRSSLDLKLNGFHSASLNGHANGNIQNVQQQLYTQLNLPFCAQCEHHLLPFHGFVHVGYFCTEETGPIDRSILQSIVHYYGCKLQVQERLTRQIAEAVHSLFRKGVMVVIEANHICMVSRGIEKPGTSTATVAALGQFSKDPATKARFLECISGGV